MPTLADVAQLITAAALAYNIWQTWRVKKNIQNVGDNVKIIEKATNSLTDRLVETTRTEAHAAGMKEEKEKTD